MIKSRINHSSVTYREIKDVHEADLPTSTEGPLQSNLYKVVLQGVICVICLGRANRKHQHARGGGVVYYPIYLVSNTPGKMKTKQIHGCIGLYETKLSSSHPSVADPRDLENPLWFSFVTKSYLKSIDLYFGDCPDEELNPDAIGEESDTEKDPDEDKEFHVTDMGEKHWIKTIITDLDDTYVVAPLSNPTNTPIKFLDAALQSINHSEKEEDHVTSEQIIGKLNTPSFFKSYKTMFKEYREKSMATVQEINERQEKLKNELNDIQDEDEKQQKNEEIKNVVEQSDAFKADEEQFSKSPLFTNFKFFRQKNINTTKLTDYIMSDDFRLDRLFMQALMITLRINIVVFDEKLLSDSDRPFPIMRFKAGEELSDFAEEQTRSLNASLAMQESSGKNDILPIYPRSVLLERIYSDNKSLYKSIAIVKQSERKDQDVSMGVILTEDFGSDDGILNEIIKSSRTLS